MYILNIYLDINSNKLVDIRNYIRSELYPSDDDFTEEQLELFHKCLEEFKKENRK